MNSIWIATIIAHILVLSMIFYRGLRLPWMTANLICGLIESVVLYEMLTCQSSMEYYYAYYICDLANIGMYVMTIVECHKRRWLDIVTFSMCVYLVPKISAYVIMWMGNTDAALYLMGALRPTNLASLMIWGVVLYHSPETQGGFTMSDEQKIPATEDIPEEQRDADGDPGAPPPQKPGSGK